jgi:hypothetical protein
MAAIDDVLPRIVGPFSALIRRRWSKQIAG